MSEALLLDDPPVTIAAFDEFLEGQTDARPWELVAGRIVGMTNPNQVHEQIVSNIGVPLKRAADGRGCFTFFGGMRIQRSDSRSGIDKPRPDLLVRCGKLQRQNFVTDPLIVVEVLSPSTMDFDRGDKLRFYKRLPTLTQIVLAYQDQMRVEQYQRIDTAWETDVLTQPTQQLIFTAFGQGLSLAEAYQGVEFVA